MILIIGGAYQGKRTFAKETYEIPDGEIFTCDSLEIDFSKRCIDGIQAFTYACIQQGKDPRDYFARHRQEWEDSILICQDIFCGVVPMEADQRAWRQETGKLCQYLSGEASRVSRIFCGLEQRLK